MTGKGKGWIRESARHSLAARGMKTQRRRTPRQASAVSMEQQENILKEPSQDAIQTLCGQLEQAAVKEAGTEEKAAELLGDDDWVGAHISQLIASFDLDDGVKTTVIGKLRKKYMADGAEE